MYVRWKLRKSATKGYTTHKAMLVESKRVNGRPRQRVIASLGSIRSWPAARVEVPLFHRNYHPKREEAMPLPGGRCCYIAGDWWNRGAVEFWRGLRENVANLNLDQQQMVAIEASIATVIPKPTVAQVRRVEKTEEHRQAALRAWYDK